MARKGQFKKGGGRVGSSSRRRSSTAIATRPRATPARRSRPRPAAPARRRRRGGGHGGGVKLGHLAIASAALAYVTGQSTPIAFVRDNAMKIPGAKTFGAPAALGVACLAVDRFVKPNKWLKLFGTAGVVLAAVKLGDQGTGFKWLGDDDVSGAYDLEGDDDISDVGDVGDDE